MSALRTALFNLYFVTLTLVLGLAGLPVRWFRRDLAFALAQRWIILTIAGLRVMCGVRIEITGREHLRTGPLIIASQHRSALDALIWFTIIDSPSYIMKRELRRLPLVGPLLEPAGMIAVDRDGGAAALRGMVHDAAAALAHGRQLVIFPEGTRVRPGAAASLAPGVAALARHAPILPVATNSDQIWGSGLLMRRGAPSATIIVAIEPALPDGLRRASLLSAIQASWAGAEARWAAKLCG